MPINPGPRHPEPTRTQRVAGIITRNATIAAYTLGIIVGVLAVLVGVLIVTIVR
jgi:hypothetical protein